MKYTIEITVDRMVQKFIDDKGRIFTNTWVKVGPGQYQTIEEPIEGLMSEAGIDNEKLLEAVSTGDLFDIWEAIQDVTSMLIVNRIDPLCANKIDPLGNKNNKL